MEIKIQGKFVLNKISIKPIKDKKNPNLLGYASISFKEEISGEYFTISGFTIWKSKFEGYNVEVPAKKHFKFCLFESSLWRKIKQKIIKKYEYEEIPIIKEEEKSSY